MECYELLTDGYGRILTALENAVKGLTQDDLNWQSGKDCNSIGWLAWHLTRVQDTSIANMMGDEQLWIKDGWHAKFNRPANTNDTGFGNTPEDVAAFKSPEAQVFIDYNKAVLERTKRYFLTLSTADLDRELNEPQFQPLPTVGVRLISVLADSLQHIGQMGYIRGLHQGKGWYKY
ncbi:DinB family protein [Chloroflexota bacterium]